MPPCRLLGGSLEGPWGSLEMLGDPWERLGTQRWARENRQTIKERSGSGQGEFKEHHLGARCPQAAALIKTRTNYSAPLRDDGKSASSARGVASRSAAIERSEKGEGFGERGQPRARDLTRPWAPWSVFFCFRRPRGRPWCLRVFFPSPWEVPGSVLKNY